EMETKVAKADRELTTNPIRRVLNSNPVNYFRKKPVENEVIGPTWEPPNITLPGDYFQNNNNLTEAINTHIL
ncbi:hypothetical protein, partial [Salmonella sp. s54836]|uniref:hypothetical protein n=1 Tax=Salmonella sp. s54836 TaxID=3159673 RepID=UPI0039813EB0